MAATRRAPARLAHRLAASFGLTIIEPPLPMASFTVSMLWHPRTEHDPVQAWVRSRITAWAEGIGEAITGRTAR